MDAAHPAIEFVTALFGPHKSGLVHIASLPNIPNGKTDGHRNTRNSETITNFVANHDRTGFGVFVCVNPLKDKSGRRKDNVIEIVCAHADIDFKLVEETPEEIECVIATLPWPPSWITHSGHGLHLYWFFLPALAVSSENIARHEKLLKQITNLLAGDPAVCEISRLMRLPGTTNSKNGDQLLVHKLKDRANLHYEYDKLEQQVFATSVPLLHRKDVGTKSGNGGSPDNPFLALAATDEAPLDVDRMLAEMVYRGPGGGGNMHDTELRCSAALLNRGEERDAVVERILTVAVNAAARAGLPFDPEQERRKIEGLCDSWIEKYPEIEERESGKTLPFPAPPKPIPYILRSLNAVLLRASKWLWPGHLPQGALEITSGGLGIGKGLLACDHAARVTTSRAWPDGSPGCEIGTVIVISAEDNAEDFKRRFLAAGADENKVKILEGVLLQGKEVPFLIARDLRVIEMICHDLGDVRLVILDPITAFMGSGRGFDSHRASDVRAQLLPLKVAAEKLNVTFSALTHPTKNAAAHAVIDNFIGSQAFIATARVGHYCIEELDEEDERGFRRPTGRVLFTHARRPSHSASMPTLAFRQEIVLLGSDPDTGKPIEVPRLVWDTDPVDLTADEAMALNKPKYGDGRKQRGQSAREFLLTLLAAEPQLVTEITTNGALLGLSVKQLKYARQQIGAVAYRLDGGIGAPYFWALSQHVPPEAIIEK